MQRRKSRQSLLEEEEGGVQAQEITGWGGEQIAHSGVPKLVWLESESREMGVEMGAHVGAPLLSGALLKSFLVAVPKKQAELGEVGT